MGKCSSCWAWQCANSIADQEAACKLLGIVTKRDGGCPAYSILPPASSVQKLVIGEAIDAGVRNAIVKEEQKLVTEQKHYIAPKVEKKPAVVATIVKKKRKSAAHIIVWPDEHIKNVQLFDHQLTAFNRYKDTDVIPLFFSMGCGKTITTLSIAKYKYTQKQIKGLLVVAPNDVHKQWYDDICNPPAEVGKVFDFPIEIQCVGGRGGQKEFEAPDDISKMQVIIVNVDTFSTPNKWVDIVEFCNMFNMMLVIDEATVIKNPSSKRSERLLYEFNDVVRRRKTIISNKKKQNSLCRAVLTGTPSTNGPCDLWAIMEFISPNYFGRNYYSFQGYYGMHTSLTVSLPNGQQRTIQVALTEKTWDSIKHCNTYQEAQILFGCSEDTYLTVKHQTHFQGPYKHADELRAKLNETATFLTLTDCVDMPATIYKTQTVQMSPDQAKAYKQMKADLMTKYDGHLATAKNQLTVAMRLSQISSGFIMGQQSLDDDDEEDIPFWDIDTDTEIDVMPNEVVWLGKSNPKLDALMRDVAEADKPLLILTRFSAEAAKIYDMCNEAGYKTGLFTGWKVVGGIDAFKAGEIDILVANSAKISRGFNLQISHTTLFYSNSFSMEIRQQAEFRTFRIGQKHPCTYIDYVASDIDQTIVDALTMKKGLLEYLRGKEIAECI